MSETLDCDLLVVGAGMAGLSAAARAAEAGARVIVVEKQAHIGGSGALSSGALWTFESLRKYNYYCEGDSALGEALLARYPEAIAWLRRREVAMEPAMAVLLGHGYRIDVVTHLRDCGVTVEAAEGGYIALESEVSELLPGPAGGVGGGRIHHADGDLVIRAPWTLLATGGFQASPELRARYIHPNARDIPLRSNPASTGGGLQLGLSAGGAYTENNHGFYGHLISHTPDWGDPRLFSPLSQFHSERSLLINEQGERFCDESLGDHVNVQRVVEQTNGRALLVWDERVHQDHVLGPLVSNAAGFDRMAVAKSHGGIGEILNSMDELIAFAKANGFDGEKAAGAIRDYNDRTRQGWEGLRPVRNEFFKPIDRPPFYAMVVRPAITFTYGGLRVDAAARVLDKMGHPIPGLLAAGADVGGAFRSGYGGGLALALVFGLIAVRTAGLDGGGSASQPRGDRAPTLAVEMRS